MRRRIEPTPKVAAMLRSHEELILNWLRTKGEAANRLVEDLNNKVRVVTRRSHGFRRCHVMQTVLSHDVGPSTAPEFTHRRC